MRRTAGLLVALAFLDQTAGWLELTLISDTQSLCLSSVGSHHSSDASCGQEAQDSRYVSPGVQDVNKSRHLGLTV